MFIRRKINCKKIQHKNFQMRRYCHSKNSVQIVSNVFLEQIDSLDRSSGCKKQLYEHFSKMVVPSSHNLLLCGNIGRPFNDNKSTDNNEIYGHFMEYCSTRFEKVFVLAAQDEYSGGRPGFTCRPEHEVEDLMETITNSLPNVEYLRHREVVLNDDYNIIGTTFESKRCRDMLEIWHNVNSQERINFIERSFCGIFYHNFEKLKYLVDENRPYSKNLIIMSDYFPNLKKLHDSKYCNSAIAKAYLELEVLIKDNPNIRLWTFGADKRNVDGNTTTCKLICDPGDYQVHSQREPLVVKLD